MCLTTPSQTLEWGPLFCPCQPQALHVIGVERLRMDMVCGMHVQASLNDSI